METAMISRLPSLLVLTVAVLSATGAGAFESDRIAVEAVGNGPAVILIPGLNSSPAVWNDLLDDLAGHQVHLVHVRGFAGLPAGGNAEGEVLNPVVEDLARYIEETGIADVSVIGHSMGGAVATQLAAEIPATIDRLMVVDLPAYFGDIMGVPAEAVLAVADQVRTEALARTPEARDAAEVAFIKAGILDDTKRQAVIDEMRASDPAVAAQVQYELMVTDRRPLLASITADISVVFVTPAQAPTMTAEQIEGFYAAQYAGAAELALEYVADSGHYVMLDKPERFAAIVSDFLD
jgi:pimeloyl-ACP methyl ester carboxylesterase